MTTQKRKDILAAALKMVSVHGFHGTSMAMIAEEAHSGAGTIYNYFPTKDDLIKTLFREIKREYVLAMLQGVDETMSLEQRFLTFWRNAIHFNLQSSEKIAFSHQYHSSPYYDEDSLRFINEVMAPVIQPIVDAMQQGILKPLPLPIFEAYTLDIITSLTVRHARQEIELTEELIEQTGRASWRAICAEPTETH